ncbi:hypothetical protein HQ447_07665 [bacterium]|nr:hypothetical protein [bacterium]
MSRPEDHITYPFFGRLAIPMTALPVSLRNYLAGNVSRSTLLGKLLPLSFISLFSTLVIAAQRFPEAYDWQRRVISHLISPRHNPDGYLISSLGMALSALLAVPFAGYVGQRLRQVSPKLSHGSSVALGVGILLVVTVTLPLNVESMPPSVRWVHEALARTAGVGIFGGMIGCCVCGWKDRLRRDGRQLLNPRMVNAWISLTLLPIVCGALAGILKLARKAGWEWAGQLRLQLKPTMLWQLAFWEWVGVVAFVLFMVIAVLLLPARVKARE